MGTPIINKTQKTEPFHAAVFKGSFDVTVVPGASDCEVSIAGDDKAVERILMRIENGELHLKQENAGFSLFGGGGQPCKVRVSAPEFSYLYLKGSGNLKATDTIKAETVKVKLGGSGDVSLTIEAAMKAQVKLDGSGDMDITAAAPELKAELNGSGDIALKGQAGRIKLELNGSGDISAQGVQAQEGSIELNGSGDIKANIGNVLKEKVAGSGKFENFWQQ